MNTTFQNSIGLNNNCNYLLILLPLPQAQFNEER